MRISAAALLVALSLSNDADGFGFKCSARVGVSPGSTMRGGAAVSSSRLNPMRMSYLDDISPGKGRKARKPGKYAPNAGGKASPSSSSGPAGSSYLDHLAAPPPPRLPPPPPARKGPPKESFVNDLKKELKGASSAGAGAVATASAAPNVADPAKASPALFEPESLTLDAKQRSKPAASVGAVISSSDAAGSYLDNMAASYLDSMVAPDSLTPAPEKKAAPASYLDNMATPAASKPAAEKKTAPESYLDSMSASTSVTPARDRKATPVSYLDSMATPASATPTPEKKATPASYQDSMAAPASTTPAPAEKKAIPASYFDSMAAPATAAPIQKDTTPTSYLDNIAAPATSKPAAEKKTAPESYLGSMSAPTSSASAEERAAPASFPDGIATPVSVTSAPEKEASPVSYLDNMPAPTISIKPAAENAARVSYLESMSAAASAPTEPSAERNAAPASYLDGMSTPATSKPIEQISESMPDRSVVKSALSSFSSYMDRISSSSDVRVKPEEPAEKALEPKKKLTDEKATEIDDLVQKARAAAAREESLSPAPPPALYAEEVDDLMQKARTAAARREEKRSPAPSFIPPPKELVVAQADDLSTIPKTRALVPINEETIEFTSGLIGGAVGLAVAGPVAGVVTAAAANYASRTDVEVGEVVRAVSKSAIQCYNYLARLDATYQTLEKARDSLSATYDRVKGNKNVDPLFVERIEKALAKTTYRMKELNDEYDLVDTGLVTLGVVGDLVEIAMKKIDSLNKEYKLTERAWSAVTQGISKSIKRQ